MIVILKLQHSDFSFDLLESQARRTARQQQLGTAAAAASELESYNQWHKK